MNFLDKIVLKLVLSRARKAFVMLDILPGNKTYIVAAGLGTVAITEYLGLLDSSMAETIRNFLYSLGAATVARKINRMSR